MATNKIGQTRPHASVISALAKKLNSPLETFQDFPEPLAYYSLYCIIEKKRKCNEKPDQNFRPFKTRDYSAEDDGFGDHLFWVRTLEDFLGERLVYSNSIHKAQLTYFGEYMYPSLMEAFLALYKQNEILQKLKTSWQKKYKDSSSYNS